MNRGNAECPVCGEEVWMEFENLRDYDDATCIPDQCDQCESEFTPKQRATMEDEARQWAIDHRPLTRRDIG